MIEVTGRRTLYLRGNLLLICALIIFTIALHVHAFVAELLAVLIFTIGFSISLGPLFWIYISDTLDESGRKYAITMSSACTLIVSLAFKPMTVRYIRLSNKKFLKKIALPVNGGSVFYLYDR